MSNEWGFLAVSISENRGTGGGERSQNNGATTYAQQLGLKSYPGVRKMSI